MPYFLPKALADWLAFHATYAALKRLDPHLKADLGLADADLRRLSRKAMHHQGPISIYRLVEEDFDEGAGDSPRERKYGNADECGDVVSARGV